jgi:hypothetical protein
MVSFDSWPVPVQQFQVLVEKPSSFDAFDMQKFTWEVFLILPGNCLVCHWDLRPQEAFLLQF